ncbi:MAG: LysR family transcriptional regulator [Rhodobacteraceae bacterium]|nr:LysR family transcriptional regulator [Paracoccaceae bacterium]
MFERRTDLSRLLAVAETGGIGMAADRSNVTQPTLTRDIARLEARLGGRLFERLPDGVRLTALGATAVRHARRILRETEDAERAIGAARSGRTGVYRITATPPWAETVLTAAAARFREAFPAVELQIESAPRAEGLRRLSVGDCDLHCGGIDTNEALPGFLRRERFLDLTAGIVAWRSHPLLNGRFDPAELARYPWIDFDWPATAPPESLGPSLTSVLEQLTDSAPAHIVTVLRFGAAGLFALARGPWLAWLSIEHLRRLPGQLVRPLPVDVGRFRYRSGFVVRRSAEDLPPFRAFVRMVRDTALGRSS